MPERNYQGKTILCRLKNKSDINKSKVETDDDAVERELNALKNLSKVETDPIIEEAKQPDLQVETNFGQKRLHSPGKITDLENIDEMID